MMLSEGAGTSLHKEGQSSKTLFEDRNSQETVYGGLYLIGCNGCLPSGDKGRKRSKLILRVRSEPNGTVASSTVTLEAPSKVVQDSDTYSISYALSEEETVTVEYALDEHTDMFQIGRSPDKIIDMIITDAHNGGKELSRFACRIIADRRNPSIVRVYAAGFDSHKNIILGKKAFKWRKDNGSIDALTTNGVLLSHPEGKFCGGEIEAGVWREVSVCGSILSVRVPRSSQKKGREIDDSTNILKDGSLIDLCGGTLLWRSSEGLRKSVTKEYIENLIDKLNGDSSCHTTVKIPRKRTLSSLEDDHDLPYIYFNCGHVHVGKMVPKICPYCLLAGPSEMLCMGMESAFYLDDISEIAVPNLCAFNPCGHIATRKTVEYWSKAPLPHGTSGYHALCPFCGTELQGFPGFVPLRFTND